MDDYTYLKMITNDAKKAFEFGSSPIAAILYTEFIPKVLREQCKLLS